LIEIVIALVVGTILGYVIRGEQKATNDSAQSKIDKLNEDVIYYKKLTKQLAEENMEFRRKQ
jgi:uncharacterized membrane-anchored protein YhcB (DUF1043 family)